jgi:hypothetical protein
MRVSPRVSSAALVAAAAVAIAARPTKAQDAQGIAGACTYPVSMTNHGGGSRPGPTTLVPIFWGESPSTSLSEEESVLDGVYSQIEQSNYYRWIRVEYGAPELHHVFPTSSVYPGQLSGMINDSDIQSSLSSWVRSGATPNVPNPVYVLHLPPGVTVNGKICSPWSGYNSMFASFDLFNGGYEGFYYIIMPEVGTCGITFPGMTSLLSHEIVESVTDNATFDILKGANYNGWEDQTQPSACGQQLGDLCNGMSTVIQSPARHFDPALGGMTNSLTVQKMWSNAMGACVTEDALTIPTVRSMTAPTMVNGNIPVGGPGTVVTFTGANFEGVPTVKFGGTPATVSCSSWTQCTAIAPSGVEGTPLVTFAENGTTIQVGDYAYPPTTAPACTITTAGCGLVTFACSSDPAYNLVTQWWTGQSNDWVQQPFSTQNKFTIATPETVRFCSVGYAGAACSASMTFTPDTTGLRTCKGACGTIPDGCGGTLDCGRCTPPNTCNGDPRPTSHCASSRGWVCCEDGWACGVCS